MYPRYHILLALLLFISLYLFSQLGILPISILCLSSVLIDLDHYLFAVLKTKKISLKKALEFYDRLAKKELRERARGVFHQGPFEFMHTIEFHLFVLVLSFYIPLFFYVIAGMIFHSLTDLIELVGKGRVYTREYFLVKWLNQHYSQRRQKLYSIFRKNRAQLFL